MEEGPAAELVDAQPSEPWAQVAEGLVGLLRAQGASRARAAHLGPKGQDHLSVFGPYVGFEAYVYSFISYHNIVIIVIKLIILIRYRIAKHVSS